MADSISSLPDSALLDLATQIKEQLVAHLADFLGVTSGMSSALDDAFDDLTIS